MKKKYESVGLNYEDILAHFPNIDEYEETVNAYLSDEFFMELENMLIEEDYSMAKDATKGLFILSQDLLLFPMYEALMEVYEDLEYEIYDEIMKHYKDMIEVHKRLRGVFHV
ncbi:MAG: hypothetical protein Q4D13_05760 [Erysipelotrichaceae bacterium]|nr:hypothetical protein [Erysipelotrichaceae bacterium]